MLSIFRDRGVVFKDEDNNPNRTADDRSIYQLVEPGWLVVNRMKAWQGSIGISSVRGIISGHYICFAPEHGEDSRFLHYLLRSPRTVLKLAAASRGVRPGQIEIDNDELANLSMPLPSLDEQRRIADFLDDQVARIDAATRLQVAQRSAHIDLVSARIGELLEHVPEGSALGSVARVVDTEHKTAPSVAGGGYWIAGTAALRNGVLDPVALRETDAISYREWTVRGVPRVGDVLLSREAPVGQVALLRDGDPEVAIGQRVVLIRPQPQALNPGFLRLVLMSPVLRRVISDASVGSLHPHLNISEITRLRLPDIDYDRQGELAALHVSLLEEEQMVERMLSRRAHVLAEYKQSLISAAVSGEFDVATASGRGLPRI